MEIISYHLESPKFHIILHADPSRPNPAPLTSPPRGQGSIRNICAHLATPQFFHRKGNHFLIDLRRTRAQGRWHLPCARVKNELTTDEKMGVASCSRPLT